MINYAELAADGDPEICAKAAAKTRTGGRRAIEICSAILAMVRSESSEPVTAPVAELIDDALTSMGRDFAKDAIELTVDVPDGLTVGARPAEMKQVLVNLLLNARSAVLAKGRGGRVQIEARRDGQTVRLAVRDSGCGIAPEHLDKLFEPFFTTKTGDAEQGTGLGLALCDEVVTGLGGRIEVESAVGEGTCFTLVLPARAGADVTAA
jgi:signal transduction histidine kinase